MAINTNHQTDTLSTSGGTLGVTGDFNLATGKLVINGSAGTTGQVLTSAGSGAQPTWSTPTSGGGTYTVSATAPTSPNPGDHWFDTTTGIEYTRLNDGTSTQWVETSAPGLGLQGPTGNTGATGDRGGVPYTFSTTITDADPGNGFIRYSSGTIGSVNNIYIDNLDQLGNTQTTWYDTWDDSTNPGVEGYLYITSASSSGTLVNVFSVTGLVTAATGYYKIPVAYVSGTLPANNAILSINYTRAGDRGATGAMAPKSITITNPTASEKVLMFFTPVSITLTEIRAVIIGTTSVDFRVNYGTDPSGAGTNTTTNAITCSTTTGATTGGGSTTTFSSATVPANNFVWLTTSALSGTPTQLHVSLIFT